MTNKDVNFNVTWSFPWGFAWLFTWGFLGLTFWQGVAALLIWPFYIGQFAWTIWSNLIG